MIASQFPLWMSASNIATEILYRGLLTGDDPRWVLHELRQRLRIDLPDTHDWASIVAYAAIAPDLESQVDSFRSRQTRLKINVKFDRMDQLVGANEPDPAKRKSRDARVVEPELESLAEAVRCDLNAWCNELAAQRDPKERAERLGMYAASEKRIAIIYSIFQKADKSVQAYRKSSELYEAALKLQPANHWVLTQFLSLAATPALATGKDEPSKLVSDYGRWWMVARQLAEWQLRSPTVLDRVWAHGTLAELMPHVAIYGGTAYTEAEATQNIVHHCREICASPAPDSFPVHSTQRQFRRYTDCWVRKEWNGLAKAALGALEHGA